MGTAVTIANFDADLELKHLSASICAELAAGLSDADGIKKKYNIDDKQWNLLRKSHVFRKMLKEALEKFAGDMNAGRRITVKSEIALEDSIPTLYGMIHDREVPSAQRIDGVKTLAMLAGRTQKTADGGGAATSGFNINIQIQTGEEKPSGIVIEGESCPSPD